MKIDFQELSSMAGYIDHAYYYLARQNLITKQELESRLAEIQKVQNGLDDVIKRLGPVYTSPNHIEK